MTPTEQHERLAGYFEEIYEALTQRGVPEDRLPSPWLILSHVLECVDYDALGEWITDYAALEATEEGSEAVEPTDADADEQPSRRRPGYLRALASPTPEDAPQSESQDVGCEVLPESEEVEVEGAESQDDAASD